MLFLSPEPAFEQRAVAARRERFGLAYLFINHARAQHAHHLADQALGPAPFGRGFPRRAPSYGHARISVDEESIYFIIGLLSGS